MNCTICGNPITLVPSAVERARKFGGTPAQYTALFTEHAGCTIRKRDRDVMALIDRRDQKS